MYGYLFFICMSSYTILLNSFYTLEKEHVYLLNSFYTLKKEHVFHRLSLSYIFNSNEVGTL